MSAQIEATSQDLLAADVRAQIDREIAKYPPERKGAAVMAALRIVQEQHGWLTPALIEAVAGYLGVPPVRALEVATFYSMYDLDPVGKIKIEVCTNISCMLCGSDKIMAHLSKTLGVKPGETTKDGKFTLKEVECLGACVNAPMMQVGKRFHENLTPAKVDEILKGLKS
jgi:NADH-quinone oxidoreductase subunit E